MSQALYLSRAERALASARILFSAEDFEAAVSRAYFGMHYAALAALDPLIQDPSLRPPKTHSGLKTLFSEKLVKERGWPARLSSLLGRAETLRLTADYSTESLDAADVISAIEAASEFIAAIKTELSAKE